MSTKSKRVAFLVGALTIVALIGFVAFIATTNLCATEINVMGNEGETGALPASTMGKTVRLYRSISFADNPATTADTVKVFVIPAHTVIREIWLQNSHAEGATATVDVDFEGVEKVASFDCNSAALYPTLSLNASTAFIVDEDTSVTLSIDHNVDHGVLKIWLIGEHFSEMD